VKADQQAARVLRAYPAQWRHEHGEALVGTLLDVAEGNGRDHLTRSETADAIRQGLAQRARVLAGEPRWRWLTVAALAAGTALALAGLVAGELAWAQVERSRLATHPFVVTTGLPVYLAWLALTVAAVTGRARWVRRVGVTTIVLVIAASFNSFTPLNRPPNAALVTLGWLAAIVALAPASQPRRARLIGAAVGIGLGAGATALAIPEVLAHRRFSSDYLRMSPFYDYFMHHSTTATNAWTARLELFPFLTLLALPIVAAVVMLSTSRKPSVR
jgi:hypothetical protein